MAQAIEIVRRRIDETGTNEPTIQQQGALIVLLFNYLDLKILVVLKNYWQNSKVKLSISSSIYFSEDMN